MRNIPVSDDYESPFPECRILATTDPHALLRFDMNREQAAAFAQQVRDALEDHGDADSLVTLGITMQEPTYRRFADQVDRLVTLTDEADEAGTISAQVLIDETLEPGDQSGISVAVLLNEEQLRGIHERSKKALSVSNGNIHRWEWSSNPDGGEMLVQQLVAALKGADDPIDHVDVEEVGRDE